MAAVAPPVIDEPVDPRDPLDERRLVERARRDPDAFAILYRAHVMQIHAYIYRRSGSRHVAEDVTAATFERALRNLSSFEWRGSGSFIGWLHRIAANELTDHFRREQRSNRPRARQAMEALSPAVQLPEEVGTDDAEIVALRAAIATLPGRYQEAISLRHLAGLSHEEAAEAMGVTKPVMAVTLHRAMRALAKALEAADPAREGSAER